MGQKIHPTGFRLAVSRNWGSRWYAGNSNFASMLGEDLKVRAYLKKKLKNASVGRIVIERPAKNARITIFSSRPGVVIGKKGEDIEVLKSALTKMMGVPVHVNIEEIRKPETDAQLIADSIAQQLEKRIMFRRAMKRAMQNAMRLGAQGIKIMSSRSSERHRDRPYRVVSRRPCAPAHPARRHRLRFWRSETTYGIIGIKVWVYKGDRLASGEAPTIETPADEDKKRRGPRRDDGKPGSGRPPARGRRPEGQSRSTVCSWRSGRSQACTRYQGRRINMLQPARRKYRKEQKGRNKGISHERGTAVSFGEFGLKAVGRGRITARQIEAARRAMTRHIKRGGRIWIRVFPDKPISNKPAEVRMGNGKGNPEYYVAEIQPGKVLYEMDGVDESLAREAFRLAAAKLPLMTTFVVRQVGQ